MMVATNGKWVELQMASLGMMSMSGQVTAYASRSCETIGRSFEDRRSLYLGYLSVKKTAGSETTAKGQSINCMCVPCIILRKRPV